tara:strand:+ start:2216 stop:2434 length:219 start_codon:yes stop_codon:yes gene_type:complete
MCIICLDIEKSKITSKDAQWALIEMANEIDEEHYYEVLKKIEHLEAKDDFKRLLNAVKVDNIHENRNEGPHE